MGDAVKTLRSILFWSHLTVGAAAGVVILIMSATGAILAMKPQILNLVERQVRFVEPHGPRLAPSALLAAARDHRPGVQPVSFTLDNSDPSVSAAIGFPQGATVYVDPYSAAVLGEGSTTAQNVFRTVENWHRWLAVSGDNRANARSITGAANVGFLLLGLSGIYLWWPRKWSAQHTRAILVFKRGARGRARDFNWHNVIGFWCAPVIVIMTATGVVMSYPWANAMLYRAAGSPLPNVGGGPRGARQAGQDRPVERVEIDPSQIDVLWSRAEQQMPTWRVMTMRLPERAGGPAAFTISDRTSWNAFARSQLTLDSTTGDVHSWQPYSGTTRGQKARGWVRFGHTGELGGRTGQVMAGLACLGGVFLVYTGISLAIRRLIQFVARSRRVVIMPCEAESE